MIKRFLLVLVVLVFTIQNAFCYSVTIKDAQQKDIKDKIIQKYIQKGCSIENATEYSFTVANVNDSFGTRVVYGSALEYKFNYSIIQSGNDVVISMRAKSVSHSGGMYQENYYSDERTEKVILDGVARVLEGYYTYGIDYKKHIGYIEITGINYSQLDNPQALSKSDKIIAINGEKVRGMYDERVMDLLTPSKSMYRNQPLTITVKRSDGVKENVTLNAVYVSPKI